MFICEGKFSTLEQWQQKNKFIGDFISSEKFSNVFGGQNFLLYKTYDFGSIRNTQRGIEVTENFSHTTIAIAFMLADKALNNQPLIINGSDDFKKAVLKTAVHKDLPIKKFFQAADIYEGVGHRRYVEIEFALPNELKTVEQYRQIIDAFIAKHLSEHYYAYAIQDKIGMLSGQRHPHVHIIFSE